MIKKKEKKAAHVEIEAPPKKKIKKERIAELEVVETVVKPKKKKVKDESKSISKPDAVKKVKKVDGDVKKNKFKDNVKTNWIEYKKKKKELQAKRKQTNKLYDITVRAKKIGEKLRVKNLKGGDVERKAMCTELHELMGGKGNYPKFVLTHDMARIIQYLLKFGTPLIRQECAKELMSETIAMLNSKYGKNCVKAMLKYGDAATKTAVVNSFNGHVVKLCSHVLSSAIFEYAYTTFATLKQKQLFAQEFYGDIYKQSKDDAVHHLRDVYEKSPDMKAAALGAAKANLKNILNKSLLDSALVHTVLHQYMEVCGAEDLGELITQLASHVVILSNSRDGVRTAMRCIWHGTNKDRKTAIKSLKEHILDLAKHEHGHCLIITLLDTADDTVLLNKSLLGEISANVKQLAQDDWGRKILLWLVAPGNSKYFHPTFVSELEEGRKKSTCKKEPEIRRKELLTYVSDSLLDAVTEDASFWLNDPSVGFLTYSILSSGSGEHLTNALDAVAKVVTQSDWMLNEKSVKNAEPKPIAGIEHAGMHMVLKCLAKNDKAALEKKESTFGQAVLLYLTKDVIKSWICSNRGCFLLVNILENNNADVVKKLIKLVTLHKKVIENYTTAGSKTLMQKLKV